MAREKGNGVCGFCEKRIHGNAIYCPTCKVIFHHLLTIRRLLRATSRTTYRRIIARIKYLEVLEAISRK